MTASVVLACRWCGSEFRRVPARRERSKYCSHSCRQKGRFRLEQWDMTKVRRKTPMGPYVPAAPYTCQSCSGSYWPTSARQKWCPVCVPDNRARTLMQRYGLSWPTYMAMLAEQGGVCALCPSQASVVDHDHATGAVRKLLCYACNAALAKFETKGWAEKATDYIAISKQETTSLHVRGASEDREEVGKGNKELQVTARQGKGQEAQEEEVERTGPR